MSIEFDWNADKAISNERIHHVSFDEAATVFFDSLLVTIPDPQHSFYERRYVTIGLSFEGRLLVVVHTEQGDRIRIISARLATRSERKDYESEAK